MIDKALVFIRNRLNAHLQVMSGPNADEARTEVVDFVGDDAYKIDSISFAQNTVTLLLVNTEQERTLRGPDPYTRQTPDGVPQRIHPDVRLNLYVLFVVRCKVYKEALGCLSKIIRYFQVNPAFDGTNAPDLGDDIERLVLELVTLPLSQQNELWSSLRVTYQPSVLYKVGLIVYRDETPVTAELVRELELRITS